MPCYRVGSEGSVRVDFDEVVRTTFAARRFTDAPVTDATIYELLEQARFAPSGGNRQGWHVIVVRDAGRRQQIREMVRPVMQRYVAQARAGENPFNTVTPSQVTDEQVAVAEVPDALIDWVESAPVMLVVCVDLEVVAAMDADAERIGLIAGASVYPFAWNILLAARNAGLGGTLTTFLGAVEPRAQALLGLPQHYAVACALPLGYPEKQLTRLKRKPVEGIASLETFDGPPLAAT